MSTNKDFCPNHYKHEFTVTKFETIRCIHCNQERSIAKSTEMKLWDSKKEHVVTEKEIIKLAENEIKSLREQLNVMTTRYESLKDAYDKLVEHKLKKIKI